VDIGNLHQFSKVVLIGSNMCEVPIKLKQGQIVPCGYCSQCMGRRINDWYTRLHYEAINASFCCFCTLTYSDEHLPEGESSAVLNFKDTQKFFKRVRKLFKGVKLKYFLCGEYGEKRKRPHYHFLLFSEKLVNIHLLLDQWGLGQTHVGEVSSATLYYVLKDMMKSQNFKKQFEVQPAIRCSQKLGDDYINQQSRWHRGDVLERTSVYRDGALVHMPRRFRNKIFTKATRDLQNIKFQETLIPKVHTQHEERVYYQGVQQRLNSALKIKHKKEKL